MADIFFDENKERGGPDSVSATFVGTDGVMTKTTTMDAITNFTTASPVQARSWILLHSRPLSIAHAKSLKTWMQLMMRSYY